MLPGAQAGKPSGALSLLLVMITRVPDSRDGLPGGGLIAGCTAPRHIREKDPGRSSHDARGADSALPAVPAESASERAARSAEGGECRAAAAARAIDVCHRSISTPARFRGSAWPPGSLAGLREYAAWAGQGFPAAIGSITGQLITDLRHYAGRQHIDFGTAMIAADQAYASQRLAAEGPFQTGLDPDQHPASALAPSPAASGLIATRQGIVTSFAEAEWLLVRTAARIDYQTRNAPASSYEPDEDDLLALSRALGGMCGQPAEQIVRRLTPQIEARIAEIERGPDTAAELGREHGQAGTEPYCDLDIDGDATALMHALGETEPMTGANYPYRLNLVTAYAQAYRQASTQGPAAAASPARIAAEGFPTVPAGPPRLPDRPSQT